MKNNTGFSYSYSAPRNKEVENIRKKYLPASESNLDLLRRLNFYVQSAGKLEALALGAVGFIMFGWGFCLLLGVLEGGFAPAAILMAIGGVLMSTAYPVSKYLYRKKRAEYAPRIIELSDEISRELRGGGSI